MQQGRGASSSTGFLFDVKYLAKYTAYKQNAFLNIKYLTAIKWGGEKRGGESGFKIYLTLREHIIVGVGFSILFDFFFKLELNLRRKGKCVADCFPGLL